LFCSVPRTYFSFPRLWSPRGDAAPRGLETKLLRRELRDMRSKGAALALTLRGVGASETRLLAAGT